jgi:hypothetical protein
MLVKDSGNTNETTDCISHWDSISFMVAVSILLVNYACLSKTWMNCLNADSTLHIQSQWRECH